MGKSALVKKALMKRVKPSYLIQSYPDLAVNESSRTRLNSILAEFPSMDLFLDGIEVFKTTESEKTELTWLSTLASGKRTVIFTVTEDAFHNFNYPSSATVITLDLLPLEKVEFKFPELERYFKQDNISWIELLRIPFYLNLIVSELKRRGESLEIPLVKGKFEDWIIEMHVLSEQKMANIDQSKSRARLLILKQVAFGLLNRLSFTTNGSPELKTLVEDKILFKLGEEGYVFGHDLYFDWAINQVIQAKFETNLQIEGKLEEFINFPSAVRLREWCSRHLQELVCCLTEQSVMELNYASLEKLIYLFGGTANLIPCLKTHCGYWEVFCRSYSTEK